MAASEARILVEHPRPGVTRLVLNRPEKLNALDVALMAELEASLLRADEDPDCRVVVLTGAGRGFCAGLDIDTGFQAPEQERSGPTVGGMEAQERVSRALTTPRRMRLPVIAAVNGPAAGGGLALALACDLRLAAESASFSAAFVRVGLSGCDCGVSWLLPRAVGSGLAFDLMLTGRRLGAEEALRAGLVADVLAGEELEAASLERAEQIIGNSPFGVEMTKRVMWGSLAIPSLDEAIALEDRTQILCTLTADQPEAVAAFRERRQPRFERR